MDEKTPRDRHSEAWSQAESRPGIPIDIGRMVLCDACDQDFTDSPRPGGFIFSSYAICPDCASKWMASIMANTEQRMIRAAAVEGQSFADFVRDYRGPNNKICVGPLRKRDVE